MSDVEKRKSHYALDTIKAAFTSVRRLRITKTATRSAEELGLTLHDVVDIIQQMTREQFLKSMTSYGESAIWQDVYNVPHGPIVLYVKLTTDIEGYLVISFKEK